jgi:hypothetical protein
MWIANFGNAEWNSMNLVVNATADNCYPGPAAVTCTVSFDIQTSSNFHGEAGLDTWSMAGGGTLGTLLDHRDFGVQNGYTTITRYNVAANAGCAYGTCNDKTLFVFGFWGTQGENEWMDIDNVNIDCSDFK